MKPYYFIIAGLVTAAAAALLAAYVPPQNPAALGVLGAVGLITTIGGAITGVVFYEDNR